MGENFHPKVEAPCNNPYHAENIWLVMFLRTFGRGRPPTPQKQEDVYQDLKKRFWWYEMKRDIAEHVA
jgi:hypothetical protein